MEKIFASALLIVFVGLGVSAQDGGQVYPPFHQLRSDYAQVGLVAHVRVKSAKYAAPDVHPLYVLESEVIEPLKGRLRRGQPLTFYIALEEGVDANRFLGEWIVFLEGSSNSPTGRWSWFTLENSSLPYSREIIAEMRKVKRLSLRRSRPKRRRAAARTVE